MRIQYPKCAYSPYREFNPIKNDAYILVEVSIGIFSVTSLLGFVGREATTITRA